VRITRAVGLVRIAFSFNRPPTQRTNAPALTKWARVARALRGCLETQRKSAKRQER